MHAYQENALAVLRPQPFAADALALIENAADALPWDLLAPMVDKLACPETSEAAKNAVYQLIAEQDAASHGLTGVCVFASAMYLTGRRMHAQGMPQKALFDSFCCLSRMVGEYRDEFSIWGFDRGFWVWRQASGRLVRLGTLEFEYVPALDAWTAEKTGLPAGEPALSVHIPSASDMSRAALDDAYRQARAFWRDHPCLCFADGKLPQGIFCHSWLLSPTLRNLLKPESGIRRFAEDFCLCDSEDTSKGCWHFLFLCKDDVPASDLPERTSLQRAVKAHLLSGGGIGSGLGLLKA